PELQMDSLLESYSESVALLTPDAGPGQALVAVVGLGHAGLSSAIALHRAGVRIVGIETSASRLEDIRGGRGELLRDLHGRLDEEDFALTDEIAAVSAADAVLICVPTMVDSQRRPSPEMLRHTCASVVRHARAGQTLVLTSTGRVGSTRELLVKPLTERGLRAGEDVFVAFSADRVDPGVRDHDQLHTPRVVGAVTETCFGHASELLSHTCQVVHRVSSPEAAEMVKLYESTFRAVNIALAFEVADACRSQGLDPIEVTDGAATKPFGFMAHYPSAGVGGHGVGVDPHYLLQPLRERGCPATLAEQALRCIDSRPRRVAMRAHELLQRSGRALRDVRVLVVGASYKPGVADSFQTPAVGIISWLREEGVQVDFHDPLVSELRVDGEAMLGVDPDPRRDASGFGPEDYDLAILVAIQPGHDYGWLRRCPEVLDCTYREPAGRRRCWL
ncbi:MAG TPA: nucleotide sugar dehydrogenase, partial [Solirubrobacteraceae bacterium]|nr:nucleotide sugar dehydrogenase [Solirubrobacteraceae bacterium]